MSIDIAVASEERCHEWGNGNVELAGKPVARTGGVDGKVGMDRTAVGVDANNALWLELCGESAGG